MYMHKYNKTYYLRVESCRKPWWVLRTLIMHTNNLFNQLNSLAPLLPFPPTAGPKSLEDYFQKVHFWVKSGNTFLVCRYQAKFAKTVPEHLTVCQIWLIKLKKFFIHIIQIALVVNIYLFICFR